MEDKKQKADTEVMKDPETATENVVKTVDQPTNTTSAPSSVVSTDPSEIKPSAQPMSISNDAKAEPDATPTVVTKTTAERFDELSETELGQTHPPVATPASEATPTTGALPTTAAVTNTLPEKRRPWPLLAFLAGCLTVILGWYLYNFIADRLATDDLGFPNPIATVNGTPVDQDLFTQHFTQLRDLAEAQGLDVDEPMVRTEIAGQALEALINTQLTAAAAAAAGISTTDEAVTQRIAELETQLGGQDGLNVELERNNLTRKQLNEQVREQLILETFLEKEVLREPITVTESEIKDMYDAAAAAGQELPPLKDIRETVATQIEQQKQLALVEEFLAKLQAAAKIEINLQNL